MPGLKPSSPRGRLLQSWTAAVDDYAIAGAWSARDELLLVADAAGGVHAFEGATGALRWAQPSAHPGGVLAASLDPRGERWATAGQDGCVLIWEARTGRVCSRLPLTSRWVEHVAWSEDGAWLAAAFGRDVQVVTRAGEAVCALPTHASTVSALAWSSAQELGTACYGAVAFHRVPEGTAHQRLEWRGSLVSMALSPQGVVACGSQDNSVHFWRRSSGQDSSMSGYPGKPAVLTFSQDGGLLATGGGDAVTVWSFTGKGPEGTRPGVLELHTAPIIALAFAARSRLLASGARDGGVALWELNRHGSGRAVGIAAVGGAIAALCWRSSGDGLAALDAHGGLSAWRLGR